MVHKKALQAALNHLANRLGRRQFLRNISLIGAVVLAAITDGWLK